MSPTSADLQASRDALNDNPEIESEYKPIWHPSFVRCPILCLLFGYCLKNLRRGVGDDLVLCFALGGTMLL